MKLAFITALNMVFLNKDWHPKKEGERWVTYCNKAVRFICEQMGVFLPPSAILANDIFNYLNSPKSNGVWQEIDYEKGFEYAKKGCLVLAVQKGDPHGHVSVLYPAENMQYSRTFKKNVPIVFNIGMTIGIMKLSYAFKSNPEPKLYICCGREKESNV